MRLWFNKISKVERYKDFINEINSLFSNFDLKVLSNKEKRLSKYASCEYLNISRATFDNYIREGKLPKGRKDEGFKELSWSIKDLEKFKNSM